MSNLTILKGHTLIHEIDRSKQIRVLHVIGTLDRAGAETFLIGLIRSSESLPIDFHLLCYGDKSFDLEEEALSLGAKIHRASSGTAIREIWGIMRKIRPDVVHGHTDLNSGVVLAVALLAGVKIRVAHSHLAEFHKESASWLRRLYENFTFFSVRYIANLRMACGNDAGHAMFGSRPFVIQPNGVKISDFEFHPELRESARNTLQSDDDSMDCLIIGSIARLEPVKNQAFLLRVSECLWQNNLSFRMVFVGQGSLETDLKRQAKELGVEESVTFLGVRDDVSTLINGFDAVVLPSLLEGFPVSAVEAQANGVPLLVSDRVDPEVCLNENCVRVSVDTEDSVLRWCSWLRKIGGSQLRRQQMSDLVRRFDVAGVGNNVYEQYMRIASRHQRRS